MNIKNNDVIRDVLDDMDDVRSDVRDAMDDVRSELQGEKVVHKRYNDGTLTLHINDGKVGGRAFWGALLILGGIALIADRLGYLSFAGFSFWTIVGTVFFAAVVIEGIAKVRVANVLFSLAFLVIIHDEWLGLEEITPWPVLGAALLLTIGIKLVFPKLGRKNRRITINGVPYQNGESYNEETRTGNKITYENAFGESIKYVSGEVEKVGIENCFGSMQVYFADAVPVNGKMKITAENAFGSVALYVPSAWKVTVITQESVFGGVKQKGRGSADGETEVFIDAETAFGSIEIRYI